MSRKICILSNDQELKIFKEINQKLDDFTFILVGSNFQMNNLQNLKFFFFDDFIDHNIKNKISSFTKKFIWSWFLRGEKDISNYKGLSLGVCFSSSIESLINLFQKYYCFSNIFLKKKDNVYAFLSLDSFFLEVLKYFSKKKKINLNIINQNIGNNYIGGKRNLNNLFSKFNFLSFFFFKIINFFKINNKKKILFIPGGKMNVFFENVMLKNNTYSWMIPSTFNKKILFKKDLSFYYYNKSDKKILNKNFYSNLLKNLKGQKNYFPNFFLVYIFKKFVFNNFNIITNYYIYLNNLIKKEKISSMVIGGELYEHFIASGYSAKINKIPSFLMPHSLNLEGYKELKKGKFKLFTKYISFGAIDTSSLVSQRVKKNLILELPFPHYINFLNSKKFKKRKRYKNALILTKDRFTRCVNETVSMEKKYYNDISEVLGELGIKIFLIKGKNKLEFDRVGFQNKNIKLDKKYIAIRYGYGDFAKILNSVDLIIGPPGTALIESTILNKDYYVFQDKNFKKYTNSFLDNFQKFFYVSHNKISLKNNILNKKVIKKNYSVNNLVNNVSLSNAKENYSFFHDEIEKAINKKNI